MERITTNIVLATILTLFSTITIAAPDLISQPTTVSAHSLTALLDAEGASRGNLNKHGLHRREIEFLTNESARWRVIMLDPEQIQGGKAAQKQLGKVGDLNFAGEEKINISVFADTAIEIELIRLIPGHTAGSWTYVGRVINGDPVVDESLNKVLITVLDSKRVLIGQLYFRGSIYRIYPISMSDRGQPSKGKVPHVVWELIPGASRNYSAREDRIHHPEDWISNTKDRTE